MGTLAVKGLTFMLIWLQTVGNSQKLSVKDTAQKMKKKNNALQQIIINNKYSTLNVQKLWDHCYLTWCRHCPDRYN